MKIKFNERCLIHIAQSNEQNPIDHCGYLQQWNDEKKIYQTKWFVLKENLLFYYNSRNDNEPNGLIILDGYRVEIIENNIADKRFPFKIDFGISRLTGKPLKSYILVADSHTDMEKWIKVLSCASYDYLKMVVSELEHRLGELENPKKILNDNDNDTNSDMTSSNPAAATTAISNQQRFNPFDNDDQVYNDNGNDQIQNIEQLTFAELHEYYGRQIRKCFQS